MIQNSNSKKEPGSFIPGLVSLIVPMYYCADYVEELLNSLTSQTYTNLEIICVIDGSPDDTLERVEQYSQRDTRIQVYSQAHACAGAARNYGLSLSQGEFLMFPDADDLYTPQYVQTMVEALEKTGAEIGVCYFNAEDTISGVRQKNLGYYYPFIPKNKAISTSRLHSIIWEVSPIPHCKVYRNRIIQEQQIRFSETNSINDVVFSDLALLCSRSVVFVKQPLLTYRKYNNPHSISTSRGNNPLDLTLIFGELYEELTKRDINNQYLASYSLQWQSCLLSYASYCKDEIFVNAVTRHLAAEAPWNTMQNPEFFYKAGLSTTHIEHRSKRLGKKLQDPRLLETARKNLSRENERLKQSLLNLTAIRRLLENEYGITITPRGGLITEYYHRARLIGPLSSVNLLFRKAQLYWQRTAL